MKYLSLCFLTAFCSLQLIAQDNKQQYAEFVKVAKQQYDNKEYASAARLYYKAFLTLDGKAYANDRYNAACSYSLAAINDSAFYHLNYMAEKSADYLYDSYKHIKERDSDLKNIRTDKRWEDFVKRLDSIKTEAEKNLNMDLVKLLDPIYEEDQGIRKEYRKMADKYKNDDPEMKAFFKKWRAVDSTNEVLITAFLDEHGWLGKDVIGQRGNSTFSSYSAFSYRNSRKVFTHDARGCKEWKRQRFQFGLIGRQSQPKKEPTSIVRQSDRDLARWW